MTVAVCQKRRPRLPTGPAARIVAALATLLMIIAVGGAAAASQNPSQPRTPQTEKTTPLDVYAPPPVVRERAVRYSRIEDDLYFGGVALSFAIDGFLWLAGFGRRLREFATHLSSSLFLQCVIVVPAFWAVAGMLDFPLACYGDFVVPRRFGLSTETFAAWLGDWGKMLGLSAFGAVFVAWIFYRIVRHSPRRWWLYFWLATIPVSAFVILIEPVAVEPLFYHFTLLDRKHPAFAARVEAMLHHAGLYIPESRLFEMNASRKTRELNAFVYGLGASKRVVIWDTTLRDLSPDEALEVVGHEIGHYVLHHVTKVFVLIELLSLGGVFLGFYVLKWSIRRWGERTGIESAGDPASLPLILLILAVGAFLASPIVCAISRHYEHQADQYALELTYGIVPNPNAAAVGAFRVLGEKDLSDPAPGRFIRFWLYTHPPLASRIRFAAHYKPWAQGKPMKLLHSR